MPQNTSKTRKNGLRTLILPNGTGMIFQRLENGGTFAVCGPVGQWGAVDFDHSRWYGPERGRWNSKPGGVK